MKKEISLKLTVMTTVPLVVAVVVASIIPDTRKMSISQPRKKEFD
jgi:hypothetical protein